MYEQRDRRYDSKHRASKDTLHPPEGWLRGWPYGIAFCHPFCRSQAKAATSYDHRVEAAIDRLNWPMARYTMTQRDERRSGLNRLHTNKGRELAHVAVDLEASEQIDGIALLIDIPLGLERSLDEPLPPNRSGNSPVSDRTGICR